MYARSTPFITASASNDGDMYTTVPIAIAILQGTLFIHINCHVIYVQAGASSITR